MMNNNKILQYLSGEMNFSERTKFESELANNVSLQDEFGKFSQNFDKLNKAKSISTELPNDVRNSILVNTNEKIVLKRKIKSIVNLRFGFSLTLILLFALLSQLDNTNKEQQSLLSFSDSEKQIIEEITKDEATIKDIYHTDIVSIETANKTDAVNDNYLSDIKEIAKYDKDFLNRNSIPFVDELALKESMSDEQIEELFSKLDTYN